MCHILNIIPFNTPYVKSLMSSVTLRWQTIESLLFIFSFLWTKSCSCIPNQSKLSLKESCFFCVSPLHYSTGSSRLGLFIKQQGLVQQWIRPSTLLWHPMDITSFHIAARCVCIDKTSFFIKKRWAGDPPSKGNVLRGKPFLQKSQTICFCDAPAAL